MGLFDSGINVTCPENLKEQIILTNKITISFIGVAFFYAILFAFIHQGLLAFIAFLIVLILCGAYFLSYQRQYLAAKVVLLWCTILAVFFYNSILGSVTGIFLFNLTTIAASMMLFSEDERFFQNVTIIVATINFFILSFDWIKWHDPIVLGQIYNQSLYASISGMTIGVMIMAIISFQSKFFHIFQQLQLINDQLFNTNTQLQTTITQLTKETEQKEAALKSNKQVHNASSSGQKGLWSRKLMQGLMKRGSTPEVYSAGTYARRLKH